MFLNKINDFSSNNQIQSFVSEVLFPLTLMQFVSLSPKYYIRGNIISANRLLTNVTLCSITALVFVIFIYFSFLSILRIKNNITTFLFCLYLCIYSLYGLGYLVNAIVIVLESAINVDLVIRIDMIERNLKIRKIEKFRLVIENWLLCIFVIIFYFLNTYIQLFHAFTSYATIFLSIFILMPWDLNVIYSARVACLLRKQTDMWVWNMKSLLKARHLSENLENFHWQAILNAYLILTDSYSVCEKITEITIIYHVLLTFVQFIINVQTLIVVSRRNIILKKSVKGFTLVPFLCILWTIKHTILLLLVCIECDKLYTSLKNSQVACLATVYENSTNTGRIACKRLRKEAQKKLQPMMAKGFFTINLTLPLQIFSIVATYTVVLLQFNFL
nr:gustatory receptor 50.1 [Papilio polytes]